MIKPKLTDLEKDLLKRRINGSFRFIVRDGAKFYSALEVELVLSDADSSAYIKTPVEALFGTKSVWEELTFRNKKGRHKVFDVNNILDEDYLYNPYLAWHGSTGRLHANAYGNKDLSKTKLISDIKTSSRDELAGAIHLVATAIIPVNGISLVEIDSPPEEFAGNYHEVSQEPYMKNQLNNKSRLEFVIDRKVIVGNYVCIDLFVHRRKTAKLKELPYSDEAEMIFIEKPFTYSVEDIDNPTKFTVFLYSPIESEYSDGKQSYTFIGRADKNENLILFQSTKIS